MVSYDHEKNLNQTGMWNCNRKVFLSVLNVMSMNQKAAKKVCITDFLAAIVGFSPGGSRR